MNIMAQKDDKYGLNHRQKCFVDEYLSNGMNARQSYLTVYQPDSKVEIVDAAASQLLSNLKVKRYLEDRMGELSRKSEVTREEILKDLIEIKNSFKDNPNSSHSLRAIDTINKMLGYYAPEKQELTHKMEQPLFGEEEEPTEDINFLNDFKEDKGDND